MNAIKYPTLLFLAALVVAMGTPSEAAETYVYDMRWWNPRVMFAVKRSNVRAGPGTSYDKVDLLDVGEKVRVSARTGNWFKLEQKRGQEARFVYAPLLAARRPESATGATKKATASSGLTTRTITYSSGDRYHGQTRNGKRHGRGVFTWANGDSYEGDFVNGKRTGRGVFTWGNGQWEGDRYEGDFVDGVRTGRGVYTWANGNRYEGQWRDDNFHGRGVLTTDLGRHEGEWRDDKEHGHGVFTFEWGDRYEGEWRDGKEHGPLRHTLANGDGYMTDELGYDVHVPNSTCLDVERSSRTIAIWVNQCRVGIDVIWRDEGACRSRAEKKYPCSWFVGANKRATAAIEGQVRWYECESPGGLGDVVTIETSNGERYCFDIATPQTLARWEELRRSTQKLTQVAVRREERRRRWEEEEEEERERELRRARQSGQTWQSFSDSILSNSQRLLNEALAEQARREAAQRRRQAEGTTTYGSDCVNTSTHTCSTN